MGSKLFIVMAILCAIFSCNPEKQILKNNEKFNRVGRKWLETHPCTNDSTIVYLPGKIDSIPYEIPIIIKDTEAINKYIDSIKKTISSDKDCGSEILSSYNEGYDASSKMWRKQLSKMKTITRVDTIKISVKDKQEFKLLNQDIKERDRQIGDLKLNVEHIKRLRDKWFFLFILICTILGLRLSYKLFKKYYI